MVKNLRVGWEDDSLGIIPGSTTLWTRTNYLIFMCPSLFVLKWYNNKNTYFISLLRRLHESTAGMQ